MPTKLDELLATGPVVINIGVEDFAQALLEQETEVVQVDWAPPAGGDQEMLELLDGLL